MEAIPSPRPESAPAHDAGTPANFDPSRAEQFAETLIGIISGGTLSLMISLGHRSGLFDAMRGLPPSTSRDIAKAAKLDERYVREWLGAMTTGRIVECDATGTLFHLPAEHAASLTRAAAADNIAIFSQYVAVLGSVEDRILECFRHGGGVPYEEFHRFHEVMAEDSGQSVLPALVDQILPLAPGIREQLEIGIEVLDVGCGRGRAMNLLAREFPNSRFAGYDLSEDAIAYARDEAKRNGTTNVRFEARDMTDFEDFARYRLITAFDAIHDQKAPEKVLAAIARALAPGGTFLMQDIKGSSHVHKNMEHPLAPMLYTVSCMHCMTVSLAQDGAGLGAMWGEELALKMLREAGFANVEVKDLEHDIQNNWYVARRSQVPQ